MVPLYDLSTTNFSCKVAIGPLNPHQGAALDPIFQIFPRFWSFLVGSTASTLPCGTPLVTGASSDATPFRATYWERLDKKSVTHFRALPVTP